jgi:hypothetical protein
MQLLQNNEFKELHNHDNNYYKKCVHEIVLSASVQLV